MTTWCLVVVAQKLDGHGLRYVHVPSLLPNVHSLVFSKKQILKGRITILLRRSIWLPKNSSQDTQIFGWLGIRLEELWHLSSQLQMDCLASHTKVPVRINFNTGDLLYASRLGLLPNLGPEDLDAYLSALPIYHFGNTGDPVYLGQCTGVTSSCYWLEYALESQCHIGRECKFLFDLGVYDVYGPPPGQSVLASIQYHSISYVIKNIITQRQDVPTCTYRPNCLASECTKWKFVE